ncbi:MAG: hypothetical protein GEU82_13835 [Luteitalea sp.]|nr:hypothetical protein [Luteitalea sp.]
MSYTNTGHLRSARSRRAVFFSLLPIVILLAPAARVQAQPGNLTFFKNYFVTGDYVVGGVNLRGTGINGVATGTISMDGVPANADILAAFLYWETEVTRRAGAGAGGAKFRDGSITWGSAANQTIARELSEGTASCRSGGGDDEEGDDQERPGGGRAHRTKLYRADVLRFLPTGQNPAMPNYGKLLVNDSDLINHGLPLHTVVLPDAGEGPAAPSTAGASLVVIYRDPGKPLNAIVIYDGGYTLDRSSKQLTQTMQGFYQAANHPIARITHIVGGGGPGSAERLLFNGRLMATSPFAGAASAGAAGPAWDNVTFDVSADVAQMSDKTSPVTTTVERGTARRSDCLSWGAIVFSTTVQDSDADGLLDVWESSTTTLYDFVNPATGLPLAGAQPLPNLRAMGADPNVQDIFLEIGYMTTPGYTNPAQGEVAAHSHLPAKEALDLVATIFRNAAPRQVTGSGGSMAGPINIHFDVGANYQFPSIDPGTNQPYPALPTKQACQANWQPSCALVPASLARGGEQIIEAAACSRDATGSASCAFPDYPGTVGWKSAFRFYRDQPLTFPAPPPGITSGEEACLAAGSACERRFDRNRKDIFHYALFAHALGLPRSEVDDPATSIDEPTTPKNTSGIADPPGGDLMVTLGFWDDHVGSPFMQASTLLHELGHNFRFRHGGPPLITPGGTVALQPNCKPNYQSAMNYLFQVRGLLNANGAAVLDYSRQALGALDENSLSEAAGLATAANPMTYLTRWFAPSSYIDQALGTTPATRRCDGSKLGPGEVGLYRVDGTRVSGAIDWNADGTIDGVIPAQDITFNGSIAQLSVGSNDWSRIDLRQVGGRRNVGSRRIAGAMSLDLGFGDVGFGDVGFGDVGFGDVGFGDVGFGDVGFGDVGFGDVGFGDVGFGDVGAPLDDPAAGEVTFDTATAVSNAPNLLKPVVDKRAVRLTWTRPHVGRVYSYDVWRVTGSAVTPANFATRALVATALDPTTSFVDTRVKPGVTYTYFTTALLYDDEGVPSGRSGVSNYRTVKVGKWTGDDPR